MTDRIDLDELAGETDEEAGDGNRGDWLWREDDAPAADPDADTGIDAASAPGDGDEGEATAAADGTAEANGTVAADGTAEANGTVAADGTAEASTGEATAGETARERVGDAVPHVPRSKQDRPVGIPKESGGAGGASARDQASEDVEAAAGTAGSDGEADGAEAGGPHGGGVDDMTMALTYRAAKRLTTPAAALADAGRWADWIGIVGEVDAHVINKFQRDHDIDADFFSGSGTAPDERLADIDRHSMFYAERMVVVGLDDEAWIAEAADWEFVPLSEAATEAGWDHDGAR